MLFWISIFIFMVRTYVHSIQSSGRPLNFEFASMFSRDALTLALSDATLVLSTGICVPFAKLVAGGWIRYHWTGVIIQHTLQTAILFGAISWTFNRCVSVRLPLRTHIVSFRLPASWTSSALTLLFCVIISELVSMPLLFLSER